MRPLRWACDGALLRMYGPALAAADRPLIAQFCGDDPSTLLRAARLVQAQCDAVDLVRAG